MSVKGHTHKEIEAYLMANIPTLKWFDKDKGQLENFSNHVIPLPAVFMSYGRTPYTSESNNVQKGKPVLRFRIAYESYEDSFSGSINQDKALAFFDFNESVYKALQGLTLTYAKTLNRIADEDDLQHKNMIVTIQEYEATLFDDSAEEGKTFVLADAELDVTYVKKLSRPATTEEKTFILPE